MSMAADRWTYLAVIAIASIAIGCGGEPGEGRARVSVRAIPDPEGPRDDEGDPAFPDADGIDAELDVGRIEARAADGGFLVVAEDVGLVPLTALGQTATLVVAEGDLPAGDYDQLRLFVDDAQLVVDGEPLELQLPSAAQSGIKVQGRFCIIEDAEEPLVLDWDLRDNLHPTGEGRWILTPVVALDGEPGC